MAASRSKNKKPSSKGLSPVSATLDIMQELDSCAAKYASNEGGCSVEVLAQGIGGADVQATQQHLEVMRKAGVVEELSNEEGEPRWRLYVNTPCSDPMYKFPTGAAPAKQHGNGGGWVADTTNVDPSVYVGPFAKVYGNAQVLERAVIAGEAKVGGQACVGDEAVIRDRAEVTDQAQVSDGALIADEALVCGKARVSGNTWVSGGAQISDRSVVSGDAQIGGGAKIEGYAEVSDSAVVDGNVTVCDGAHIEGEASICERAAVRDDAVVCGDAMVRGDAEVVGGYYLETGLIGGQEVRGTPGNRPFSAGPKPIRVEDSDLHTLAF